ncbi:ATP synthase subunit B [Magnetospira sp. QH-2]|uniref:F0F1 ATP synthase subunit B family protein n=1 Tax=Magnetospira sp. (strain QH-2) TaxID=1288970 RepID=UPI0003E8194A|nr:ATP synthase subunit B [Magnetospira sp. QH-2]CCQ72669.1 ATP synthase subunit B, membrane-bound, F0 sector [Magnetospira sp. QH-2]
MLAQAANAAEGAAQHGEAAFYTDPTFWVFVSFVIFVAVAGKTIFRVATIALDDRAETIRKQLDEAEQLRREAKEMLAGYQRKQREATEEAEQIVARAKAEAERIRARAEEDLESTVERREQQAKDRIAQAETKALAEVQAMATDVAMTAAKALIVKNLKATGANKLVEEAISELGDNLH